MDTNSINRILNDNSMPEAFQGGLLPIGTVVALANDSEKVVIVGFGYMDPDYAGMQRPGYDYFGFYLDKGFYLRSEQHVRFRQEDVKWVYHVGYSDGGEINRASIDQKYTQEEKYPVGTVVHINDSVEGMSQIMITKHNVRVADVIKDYCGVQYPEGTVKGGLSEMTTFDDAEIDAIYHIGYEFGHEIPAVSATGIERLNIIINGIICAGMDIGARVAFAVIILLIVLIMDS